MHTKQMIELMEKIARNLILEEQYYLREFEQQKNDYARMIEARIPFYWLVKEDGCERICKDNEKEMVGLTLQIDFYYQFQSTQEEYLYDFDGETLLPVSRKRFLKQEKHRI